MFNYSLGRYVFRFRRACLVSGKTRRAANAQTRFLIADIRFQQEIERLRWATK